MSTAAEDKEKPCESSDTPAVKHTLASVIWRFHVTHLCFDYTAIVTFFVQGKKKISRDFVVQYN